MTENDNKDLTGEENCDTLATIEKRILIEILKQIEGIKRTLLKSLNN